MAKRKRPKQEHPSYRRPYLDSSVFIGWIKGEKIKDGAGKIIDRGAIGEHILTQAEQSQFPIVISSLTIAEVHKKKGKEKLSGDENKNVLLYFEHDFVVVQTIDRQVGEEANRLCRNYEEEKLSPADAIHVACALRAGCDVLLAWDGPLLDIKIPGLRLEPPRKLGQMPLWEQASETEHARERKTDQHQPVTKPRGMAIKTRPDGQ